MNPRLFSAYLSTVKNGGRRTTSNFMQEHGPSGSVMRALGAGIAGAVVNPGRLTRNLVATGLGAAVNQLASPQSALHRGLKNLGTNPGVFSAAGAAALHPSISDEALQHGGYQVPANRAGDGMRTFYPDKATLNPGPGGIKGGSVNPRIFGAYLSTLKSAMAANPNANGLMSPEDQARQKAQTFEGRLNPNWNGLMSPEEVTAYHNNQARQKAQTRAGVGQFAGNPAPTPKPTPPPGVGQFAGNPAPTPKPTPPPGVGQFMGNPRPTPAPTPADTPGAGFGPGPGPKVKSSYDTTLNALDDSAALAGGVLGRAIGKMRLPGWHGVGSKAIGLLRGGLDLWRNHVVNPQHGSAAQAAFANPNISDEALQHGGYQVPAAPKVPSVPGLKKSTINPRIFGAMIASFKSAAATNPAYYSAATAMQEQPSISDSALQHGGYADSSAERQQLLRSTGDGQYADTPGARASNAPMSHVDRTQVNARLAGQPNAAGFGLGGNWPPKAQTAPAAAAGLGGRMFNNAARLFTPWPAMLGRAAANKTQQAPASAPPPPQHFMSTGQTGKPTPAAAPKAPASPMSPPQHFMSTGVPGTKKSTINPRIFGAMVAQLR